MLRASACFRTMTFSFASGVLAIPETCEGGGGCVGPTGWSACRDLWTTPGLAIDVALTSLEVVGGGQVDAFSVVPEQIRQSSGHVSAEAETVRRVGGSASGAAVTSAVAVGEVSLADALRELAAELDRCCRGLASAIDNGATMLRRSADAYVASDDEVRLHTALGQP